MRTLRLIVVCAFIALSLAAPAPGDDDYRFQVKKNISHIFINKNGSIDIEYEITFHNSGKPIDVVDIGLPHAEYDLASATADLDGEEITDIRTSAYIDIGVEVRLGSRSIPAGKEGTLRVSINCPKMVFPDTEDENYASVRFAPTWFHPGFCTGSTYLEVNIHFPPGVTGDETKWHGTRFTCGKILDGRAAFTWVEEAASQRRYGFGVSFPRRYVNKVFDPSTVDFRGHLEKDTGFDWRMLLGAIPFLVIMFFVMTGIALDTARRGRYSSPKIGIESLGPRKDLDPVEAAALLGVPAARLVALILMQLELKDCVRIKRTKPPDVEVLENDRSDIEKYERFVLKALTPDVVCVDKRREAYLARAAAEIIKDVRMKLRWGYSRKATIKRYKHKIRSIADKAENKPEPKEILWLMLAEDAADGEEEILRRSPESPRAERPRPRKPDARAQHLLDYYVQLEVMDMWLVHDNDSFNNAVSEITIPPSRRSVIAAWIRRAEMESGGSGYNSGSGFSCACACACACAGCACACAGGGR